MKCFHPTSRVPLRGIKVKVKYHGGDEQESVEPQIRIEHTVKPLQLVPLLPHSGHESKRRGYNWGMKAKKEYHFNNHFTMFRNAGNQSGSPDGQRAFCLEKP